jgi:hypothetical protein
LLWFILLTVTAIGIAVPLFLPTRARAEQSAAMRTRLITISALGLAIGLGLAVWLPRRVPETNGSPASLVAIALLWVIGGGIVFATLPALLGALFAKPGPTAKDLST